MLLLAVRIEWCKAWTHKIRWKEEVMLVHEEMKRVLRFLYFKADWWLKCQDLEGSEDVELVSGRNTYALCQSVLLKSVVMRFCMM